MKNKNVREFPTQSLESVGSPLHLRKRSKEERIKEVLCDLQLAIQGFVVNEGVNLRQSTAAFARACSIFLRKTVIGDQNDRGTRLLDDEFCQETDFGFDRLRSISGKRETLFAARWTVGRSFLRVTRLGNTDSEPNVTRIIPVGPQRLEISVEWPLPGMADWVKQPTDENPWVISMEELFEMSSNSKLGCDNWLGQQLVLLDGKGITLKDVIRVTANSEGAHSSSISSLSKAQGDEDKASSRILKDRNTYFLSGIRIYGVKYSHAIVIETALYLYIELARRILGDHPEGGREIPLLCFTPKDVFSPDQQWLRFDGGSYLPFGGAGQVIAHRIRAPKPR